MRSHVHHYAGRFLALFLGLIISLSFFTSPARAADDKRLIITGYFNQDDHDFSDKDHFDFYLRY